ncbi:uncharacterized protein EDB93DRAFT_1099664 [Suillus bovinus]|uniref:uncharacterized protein n=1 Tax=Suillus bovinus TaxID=48563 RepID=UPI001B881F96|nr:uncharacterized protein EDB93DRAFT_1099664 [Suillus bovinus]KAG2159269.1 hypothetical protein EDB93DRAFT_1099664 [Suillus bovinus]
MPNTIGKNDRVPSLFRGEGYSNTEIVSRLRKHYDADVYNASIDLLKKRHSQWGLKSACGKAHATTSPAIERVRARFHKQACFTCSGVILGSVVQAECMTLDLFNNFAHTDTHNTHNHSFAYTPHPRDWVRTARKEYVQD